MKYHQYKTCDNCGTITIGRIVEASQGGTDHQGFKVSVDCQTCRTLKDIPDNTGSYQCIHTMRVIPDGSLSVTDK